MNHLISDESLTHAVNAALANVEPDHNGASVSFSTSDGITAVLAHRVNKQWTIAASANLPPNGKLGAEVRSSWKW